MKRICKRLVAVCLMVCLLPVFALAEETNNGTPVTRSQLEISLRLHPDGFPNDGAAHYQDWADFLSKISLKGEMKAQSFLSPFSRVMLDGALCLKGESVIPFEYDGYYSFRYLRSPAFRGDSIHFQMFNFFQFMLKGYYFMGLPTNLLAIPLYPEAAVEIAQKFAKPAEGILNGEGSRTVSYDELYELAQAWSLLVNEDVNDKLYYFLTCLLIDVGGDYLLLEKLGYAEGWLDFLDPEQKGLAITVEDGAETWVLGDTVVFEKTADSWRFTLPDEEGYLFGASWENTGDTVSLNVDILFEDSPWLCAALNVDGLSDPLAAAGTAALEITGDALWEEIPPIAVRYRLDRTAETLPCGLTLECDWINPATGREAIGFTYTASMEELPYTAVYDRPIDNQDDFFHLNESFMAEYKARYMPSLALAAAPFVMELPSGVISDLIGWMDEYGFLAFLGLE